ncbi:hypothetical protein ACILDT_09735 [Capnocytophaga canis]|uniref:hypothetical protein n=1 Tax=Capnocytophaga canis TaxID=1848903 RepID=UPI0037CE03AF
MKTLNFNQMENVQGGGDILTDRTSCDQFVDVMGGVTTIFSFASLMSGGALGGLAFGLGAFTYGVSWYCKTL